MPLCSFINVNLWICALTTNILIKFLQMSGEIPDASPDRHSIRSPTSSYVDPSVPGILSYIINHYFCRFICILVGKH
jgi:hypothetical protein